MKKVSIPGTVLLIRVSITAPLAGREVPEA
jgi:hypothetical protein